MLTRPGSPSGPAWMRRLSVQVKEPAGNRRFLAWFWAIYAVFLIGIFALNHSPRATAALQNSYESPTRIAGLPLVALGPTARGVIAIGGRAAGVIALGGIAIGGIAIGGLAAGGIAVGGVSLGLLAISGLAIGWWALGGGAFGRYAFGGLAVGGHAYAGGGVAIGYHEASGAQKEKLMG